MSEEVYRPQRGGRSRRREGCVLASAGRPQAGRTAARLCRWFVPKKSLCSLPKAKAFPREQWFQSRWFLTNFGARRFPKGNEGKQVSSGYNRRRRLATGRSGKQQAERTAVRTAPIVCPEESPLVRPQAHTPVPERPDAPTTARLVGLPPRGGQYFLSKRKKVPKKAGGTATPEAARPAARYSQISAFRALPCPALVFAQACQSLTAYGSCAHWARAPSRPKLRPAGAERLDAPNKFGASNSGP